jgi:DNA repair exonuclease SbcCD ATPase subunit
VRRSTPFRARSSTRSANSTRYRSRRNASTRSGVGCSPTGQFEQVRGVLAAVVEATAARAAEQAAERNAAVAREAEAADRLAALLDELAQRDLRFTTMPQALTAAAPARAKRESEVDGQVDGQIEEFRQQLSTLDTSMSALTTAVGPERERVAAIEESVQEMRATQERLDDAAQRRSRATRSRRCRWVSGSRPAAPRVRGC